jgi:hypothetical protein
VTGAPVGGERGWERFEAGGSDEVKEERQTAIGGSCLFNGCPSWNTSDLPHGKGLIP